MTDRERLIGLLNATFDVQDALEGFITAQHTADHLLANGVIVPPCKVGDTIYRIVEMGTRIHYKQVGRFEIGHTRGYKIVPCTENIKRFIRSCAVTKNNFFDVCENIGETVFLTKEEAEQALKEREGK